MALTTHSQWRELAITLNQLRVIPRAVMVAYLYFSWDMLTWIQGIPEPTNQHTAMFTVLIGGIVGMFTAYANTGKTNFIIPPKEG